MWKPYLTVIAEKASQALHVVDRFHVVMNLNKALDQVRREESCRLRGSAPAKRLKKMRWKLLRRGSRVRGRARAKLESLLASRLATARAWNLKEAFHQFWRYRSVWYPAGLLDYWCQRPMRSRLEPIKRIARMLRAHEELLLNWFRARGEISSGAVEGLNNKIRVVTQRSYGFRTDQGIELDAPPQPWTITRAYSHPQVFLTRRKGRRPRPISRPPRSPTFIPHRTGVALTVWGAPITSRLRAPSTLISSIHYKESGRGPHR